MWIFSVFDRNDPRISQFSPVLDEILVELYPSTKAIYLELVRYACWFLDLAITYCMFLRV